jgi:hypothetical protein
MQSTPIRQSRPNTPTPVYEPHLAHLENPCTRPADLKASQAPRAQVEGDSRALDPFANLTEIIRQNGSRRKRVNKTAPYFKVRHMASFALKKERQVPGSQEFADGEIMPGKSNVTGQAGKDQSMNSLNQG